jgi:CheY-like chemotaxis protein
MLGVATFALTALTQPSEPFVLLVDDHEPSLRQLQTVLETIGYPCVATTSPTNALAMCDTSRPALVVTDLAMPRLDGVGLARGLKARHPTLPILLVTGETLDEPTRCDCGNTFAGVFTKPLSIEPFLAQVAILMRPDRPRSRAGP